MIDILDLQLVTIFVVILVGLLQIQILLLNRRMKKMETKI
jgi:hypothetical protein